MRSLRSRRALTILVRLPERMLRHRILGPEDRDRDRAAHHGQQDRGELGVSLHLQLRLTMLVYRLLALLNVVSIAPRTLSSSAIPATANILWLSKTLPRTRLMTLSCRMHRAAATMRLVPMPRPSTPLSTASKTIKSRPIATLIQVSWVSGVVSAILEN